MLVAPRPAPVEIDLDIGLRQFHSRRTAVHDTAQRKPMAFAERRNYERFSETVARHLLLPDLLPKKSQITAGQQKHPGTALLEFEPDKWQLRVGSFKCCLAVADLAHEYSIVCHKSRGIFQNLVN